jgi:hypothetical protein
VRAVWLFAHPAHGCCFPECWAYSRCHCPCGLPANIYRGQRDYVRGYRPGEPYVFLGGHRAKYDPQGQGHHPWTRIGVPMERVGPLVDFLVARYGTQLAVSQASGIGQNTLNHWYRRVYHYAKPDTVLQLTRFVLAHRQPRDPWDQWSDPALLPTPEQQAERAAFEPKRMAQRRNQQTLRDRKKAS